MTDRPRYGNRYDESGRDRWTGSPQDLHEYGVWHAWGEDEQTSLRGPRLMADLGLFEGEYIDVLDHVCTLRGWINWGGGGHLERVRTPAVTRVTPGTAEQVRRQRETVDDLRAQLELAEARLLRLEGGAGR